LDQLRQSLVECINRCVERYTTAVLQADQNSSFDELTASLGDDIEPRPGADGWRKAGKRGFRTCVIQLLNSLHNVAITKQRLRQIIKWSECQLLSSFFISISSSLVSGIDWSLVSDPCSQQLSELVKELAPTFLRAGRVRDDWTIRWGGIDVGSYILRRFIELVIVSS
jgi:hypothetical protein